MRTLWRLQRSLWGCLLCCSLYLCDPRHRTLKERLGHKIQEKYGTKIQTQCSQVGQGPLLNSMLSPRHPIKPYTEKKYIDIGSFYEITIKSPQDVWSPGCPKMTYSKWFYKVHICIQESESLPFILLIL